MNEHMNKQWYAVIRRDSGEAVSFGTNLTKREIAVLRDRGLDVVPIPHRPCAACTVVGYIGNHDGDAPRRDEKWDPTAHAVVADPIAVARSQKEARLVDLRSKVFTTGLTSAEAAEARRLATELALVPSINLS